MKNIFVMTAALVMMAMTANAQTMKRISKDAPSKTWTVSAAPQKVAKKAVTRAGELAANQRYINYSYDDSFVWPSDFAADTEGAISLGTMFYNDAFAAFQDCKIVGARFYLTGVIGSSKVTVCKVTSDGYVTDALLQKDVPSTVEGWNYVWFDDSYKIDVNDFYALLPYYDYTPANKPAEVGNPIGSSGNWVGAYGFMAYGDIQGTHDPSSYQWTPIVAGYTSTTEGSNLMIQLIIEKENGEFILHDLVMDNIANTPFTKLGEIYQMAFTCHNEGRDNINSVKFALDIDGKRAAAFTYDEDKITDSDYANVPVGFTVPEDWTVGEHKITVYPLEVEGVAPGGMLANDTLSTTFKIYKENFDRKLNLVEFFSNQKSKYSYFGNENLYATRDKRKTANVDGIDDLAIVDIHGETVDDNNNTLTDEFAVSEAAKFAMYSTSAPASASINRYFYDDTQINLERELAVNIAAESQYKDQVVEVLNGVIDRSAQLYPSFSTVNIISELDGDKLYIRVRGKLTQDYEKLIGEDARLTVYLTEDKLTGKQQTGETTSKPRYSFNNVLRKIVTNNLGDKLQVSGDSYENDYTVVLDKSWKSKNMKIVAFVSRPMVEKEENGKVALASALTDVWVDNTAMVAAGDSETTGIAGVENGETLGTEVARYTIDGQLLSAPQKGVNLVKLSNGKVVKVIVK